MKATYQASQQGMRLNVRKNPNIKAEVLGIVENGTVFEVEKTEKDWAKVSAGKLKGYASMKFLKVEEDETEEKRAEVEEVPAEVPTEADVDATPLEKMSNAELLKLAEQSGVKVSKSANKATIIAAILGND